MDKALTKEQIDAMTYEQLLRKWRFAPLGDPTFQAELGEYYSTRMEAKRAEVGPEEHTRISKLIGWDR
jgi:hypothetical protein